MSHYKPSSQSSLDICTTPNTLVPVRAARLTVPARGAPTTKPALSDTPLNAIPPNNTKLKDMPLHDTLLSDSPLSDTWVILHYPRLLHWACLAAHGRLAPCFGFRACIRKVWPRCCRSTSITVHSRVDFVVLLAISWLSMLKLFTISLNWAHSCNGVDSYTHQWFCFGCKLELLFFWETLILYIRF